MYLKTFGIFSHKTEVEKEYTKYSCIDIDIISDINKITATTGTVILNRYFFDSNKNRVDIKNLFERGDEVLVTFGYLPSNLSTEEDFMRNINIFGKNIDDKLVNHSTFTLYISKIKINDYVIEVSLEDYMFNLKNHYVAFKSDYLDKEKGIIKKRAKTGASVNMSYGVGFKKAHIDASPKKKSTILPSPDYFKGAPFITTVYSLEPRSTPTSIKDNTRTPSFRKLEVREVGSPKPLLYPRYHILNNIPQPPAQTFLNQGTLPTPIEEGKAKDVITTKSIPSIDLISTIKKGLQEEYPELEKDQIVVFPKDLKIEVEQFKIVDVSWGQFIEKVAKEYGIKFTFYGKKLFIYLPYLKAAREKSLDTRGGRGLVKTTTPQLFDMFGRDDSWKHFDFDMKYEGFTVTVTGDPSNNQEGDFFNDNNQVNNQVNIQPTKDTGENMEYFKKGDVTLQIKGKNFKRDGKYEEYKYPDTNAKYDITIDNVFFNLNKTDFIKKVQNQFNNNLIFGFKGSFLTYGLLPDDNTLKFSNNSEEGKDRLLVIGDRVSFHNSFVHSGLTDQQSFFARILVSFEEYLVNNINYKYGSNGITQKVEIGRQI